MPDFSKPLIVHIASGDLWAGAEVQLLSLVRELSNYTTFNITVVLLNHGRLEKELKKDNITVYVIDEARLSSLRIFLKLIHFTRQNTPCIIHTHRTKENVLGSIASLFSRHCYSIRTVHGAPENTHRWYSLHKQAIYQIDRACGIHIQKAIVSVSSELASHLKNNFPESSIHVIKNGCRPTSILTDHHNKTSVNKRPFNIGFAGRLVPVKRVETVIQTARVILDSHPDLDVHFYIYGDGPLRSELEKLSSSMYTDNIVTFLGHSDTLSRELCRLDAMILTSEHEGLPMILLEAMAEGVPVIAAAVGGIPELLVNGKYGRLIHSNESTEYAAAIHHLYINPTERTKLADSAKIHVLNNYSVAATANAYYDIYKKSCQDI